jgi:hypothetical protein
MRRILIACLLVGGCGEEPIRHGNAALGVADFAVRATASELDVVGTDSAGAVLARLQLRTGTVTPEDWGAPTTGRELRFEILGNAYPPFVSAGLAPLSLPLTGNAYLNTFVIDPFVAQQLDHWGVVFADHVREAAPEVAYSECTLNTNMDTYYAPCNNYGERSSCFEYWGFWNGAAMWQQNVVCNDPAETEVERMCAAYGVVTPCGVAGPNGCAPCGTVGNGGSAQCVNDSCQFVHSGGGGTGGGCGGTGCFDLCTSDTDCCACGGFCGSDGLCVY